VVVELGYTASGEEVAVLAAAMGASPGIGPADHDFIEKTAGAHLNL
jgi:hypothetical protein